MRPVARILVVDDMPAVRDVLKDYFDELGYRVDVAEDGYQAIRAVTQTRPDIVLLDLLLPGLDGEDVLTCLRLHDPALPVIILSGSPDPGLGKHLLARGAFDYVPKPVHFGYLERVIETALAHAAQD